jgi:hypothetical protein
MTQPELFSTQSIDTLSEARQAVQDNLTTGGMVCPCCGLKARAWRLSLHSGMIKWLIALYRETLRSGDKWIDVQTVNQASGMFGGDYAKLRHWGFVEAKAEQAPDEKRSIGLWRITNDGIGFLQGLAYVPRHIWTYNNAVIDQPEDSEIVFINDIHPFDFKKLMEIKSEHSKV